MSGKLSIILLLYCCVAVKSVIHRYDSGIHRLQCDCGIANERTSKIIGGSVTTPHKYPWMVWLYSGNAACGGALITRHYVLTAAHCVDNARNTVVSISVHDKNRPGQRISASMVKIHPYFKNTDPHSEKYDIALIKLRMPVVISKRVRTLCLPHNVAFEKPGRHAIVAGWGITRPGNNSSDSQILKEVNMKIMNAGCIITAGGANRTGAYTGDSGSPLFNKYSDGRYHVMGVTSSAQTPPQFMAISYYSRVFLHNRWILRNIRDSAPCHQMASVATNLL